MTTDSSLRGVIEGFYGYFYTFSERNDLIKFMANNDFNYYIYAPKNDRQHRDRWRENYPEKIMDKFQKTVELANKIGIKFNYALSPISMCYSSDDDIGIIKDKFLKFYNIGVRDFSLMVDDISHSFPHDKDNEVFASIAEAHVSLSNHIYEWLQGLDESCHLIICPTDYHGKPPYSNYIKEFGKNLHPEIDVFFTGPDICSREIKSDTVKAFADSVNRKPLIWDNYPVNDLAMQDEMHIGPITGRDSKLLQEVKGIIVNTMIQPEASKISLLTFRDYFNNPDNYQAYESWDNALKEIVGQEASLQLKIFAENSLKSCLEKEQAAKIKSLIDKLIIKLIENKDVSDSMEFNILEQYLDKIDFACYYLLNWMDNEKLREELLPWIDLLKHKYWMAKRALTVLKDKEKGNDYHKSLKLMQESAANVRRHKKSIAGNSLEILTAYIKDMVG